MFLKNMINWILVLMYVLLNSFGAAVIKIRLQQVGPTKFISLKNLFFYFVELFKSYLPIVGFLSIFLSAFVWMAVLSRMELTIVHPIATGLNFAIIIILGFFLFGEPITTSKLAGILLIFISILLLTK